MAFSQKLASQPADLLPADRILLPFYIHGGRVFELYDFELHIRLVDTPDTDRYLLQKTGRKSVGDIDPAISGKLANCYIPWPRGRQRGLAQKIRQSIRYVAESAELQNRIEALHGAYSENELYFEIY